MRVFRQIIIFFTLVFIWLYIGWRIFFTLPSGFSLIPAILLLLAETIQATQNTLLFSIVYKQDNEIKTPLLNRRATVDIFLATYNEPIDIVRRTLVACQNIDYPTELLSIWICDDGRREEMKNLASTLGVGYITRDNNTHAKAGNLNNALTYTHGEFIVTIDADMMPKPSFLQQTLGYFDDEAVAFVQTPQSFYNEDIFQYNLGQGNNIPNEQDLFMRVIQNGIGRYNSTLYVGSNTVFRRSAIQAIGGFATGTITEDMATGMLIQSKGFKTIFHNEVLAQGLAAETLQDYLSQRIRWARGTIQTMRKWNPLTLPGLNGVQRLVYSSYFLYWFFGVFRMVFLLAPILYLLFGIPALVATLEGMLLFWVPQYILSVIVEKLLLENRLKRTWSSIYEVSVAPFLAWAVLVEVLTKKGIPFKVTTKGVTTTKAKINISYLIPHLIFIGIGLLAIIVGIINLQEEKSEGILINLFWAIYNVIISIPVILLAREKPKVRKAERFKKKLIVDILDNNQIISGSTIDISESGCRLFVGKLQSFSDNLSLVIHGTNGRYVVKGSIVYYDTYQKGYQLGVMFHEMEDTVYKLWVKEVYGKKPSENLFTYKRKTGILHVVVTYLKNRFSPTSKKKRTIPRLETEINCQVIKLDNANETLHDISQRVSVSVLSLPISEKTNAVITDIGYGGCGIIVKKIHFNLDELIGVLLPNNETLYIGQVVRTTTKRNKVKLGIKWLDSESGQQVFDYIKNLSK
ncbi:glycosyltransferase family 2 protein [Fredinandcohnia humi]